MKLTEEQKQSICDVYERAMTLRESLPDTIYISFAIEHGASFRIDAYEQRGLELSHLAGDRTSAFSKTSCDRVLKEIKEYCEEFLNNKEAAKQRRIAQLEKELANLKGGK